MVELEEEAGSYSEAAYQPRSAAGSAKDRYALARWSESKVFDA
jgi:hypothetical protein